MTRKQYFANCGWHGNSDDTLRAPNPFDPEEVIWGCPKCKTVNEIYPACDEEGCWEPTTCGTPTEAGYRTTCGKHKPGG